MNPTLKAHILRYWLAMNASAFDSAVNAVYIFCGLAGVSQAASQISLAAVNAMNLQQLGFVFLIAFTKAIIEYLRANPISKSFADTLTPEALAALSAEFEKRMLLVAPQLPTDGSAATATIKTTP